MEECEPGQFGPIYPTLPSVEKFRKAKKPDAKAYGQAVHAAIRTLQRQELARAAPSTHKAPCASGTWHTCGKKIRAAIRQQHRAQFEAQVNKDRRNRSDGDIAAAYWRAMDEKREREAAKITGKVEATGGRTFPWRVYLSDGRSFRAQTKRAALAILQCETA